MTAKEKAEELFMKFYNITDSVMDDEAKECALILVDEIVSVIENGNPTESQYNFWQNVKTEINKILKQH